MLEQTVQDILVYVVMVTVLKGLIADEKFLEIFRFISGMILILLCLTPILSVVSGQESWYRALNEHIFQEEISQITQETKLAEGNFEDILLRECREELERQFREIAREEGEQADTIEVELEKDGDGELSVHDVSISIRLDAETVMAQEDAVAPVDRIKIGTRTGRSDAGRVERKQDEETRKIKKQICDRYGLSEKEVTVWRESGENG